MSVIFIGGSRSVTRLSGEARDRLQTIVRNGFDVVVGDANGADKAVQKHLVDWEYGNVTVFCSSGRCRNNLGQWPVRSADAPASGKGFQFYAAKDREMAREADFGLMLWDGKSPGTVLNVLRLIRAGKKAVLLNTKEKKAITFKAESDWERFLSCCDPTLTADLRERATPEEWRPVEPPAQAGLFETGRAVPAPDER